ncbi:MAG: nucleoside triphosphate pyrophosphohydrolase [Myxococcota bacterium]
MALMRRLLEPGSGCPWDQGQTYASLRRYVQEEAAEVVDAIERGDRDELRDELGDLLFQVVFLTEIARTEGHFGPDDVIRGIVEKLVRRHPHVFGDEDGRDPSRVQRRWEEIKAQERADAGVGPRGPLEGVPRSLPGLARAQRVGRAAARQGFDWPDAAGPRAKVDEELAELDEAIAEGDPARVAAELGDVLLSLTNLARHLDVDAERTLHQTVRRFASRFEEAVARLPTSPLAASPEAWERAWEMAKAAAAADDA